MSSKIKHVKKKKSVGATMCQANFIWHSLNIINAASRHGRLLRRYAMLRYATLRQLVLQFVSQSPHVHPLLLIIYVRRRSLPLAAAMPPHYQMPFSRVCLYHMECFRRQTTKRSLWLISHPNMFWPSYWTSVLNITSSFVRASSRVGVIMRRSAGRAGFCEGIMDEVQTHSHLQAAQDKRFPWTSPSSKGKQ